MPALLDDPSLNFAADILDDVEQLWVANSNRLRQLTRSPDELDEDGIARGFGLNATNPDVARLQAMVTTLEQLTTDATRNLERVMRRHPLHPWIKAQKGIGDKQAARLLAAIRDPYWNTLHDRPRTVSELWAYCGWHVLPVGHRASDAQGATASEEPAGGGISQRAGATQGTCAGVAPRRQRGQKSNWSEDARKRTWLIVQSIIKSGGPWREVYDKRKATTEGKLHDNPCIRCGPSGKPAQPGSPWSDGHRHADAIRITAKEILKALWVESRRIHELPASHGGDDAQSPVAGRDHNSSSGQCSGAIHDPTAAAGAAS